MTEIDTEQVRGFWRKVFAVNHVERYAYKRILALCDALDACRQERDEWKREAQHWSSRPQEEAARARSAEARLAEVEQALRDALHRLEELAAWWDSTGAPPPIVRQMMLHAGTAGEYARAVLDKREQG